MHKTENQATCDWCKSAQYYAAKATACAKSAQMTHQGDAMKEFYRGMARANRITSTDMRKLCLQLPLCIKELPH